MKAGRVPPSLLMAENAPRISPRDEDDLWFWCIISQITIKKKRTATNPGEVWDNFILINAKDAPAAYEKAMKIGEQLNGDCRGTLRLYGHPAETLFLGVKELGLVHEDIEDGAELAFWSKRQTLHKARQAILGPESLATLEEIVNLKKRTIRSRKEDAH